MTFKKYAAYILIIISVNASAFTVVNEKFLDFKIPDNPIIVQSGGPMPMHCSTEFFTDPDNQADIGPNKNLMVWTLPTMGEGYDWAMIVSDKYGPTYKDKDKINGSTKSFAHDSTDYLRYHAESTANDSGFGLINKKPLDKNKFLTVEASFSLDTCFGNGSCTNGPALINTEADYRAVYLKGSATGDLTLTRYAPCDERPLFTAEGTEVTVKRGTQTKIRLDYAGATDGSWRYWWNDKEVFIKDKVNGTIQATERGDFLNASLKGDGRVGLYPNVNGDIGNYIEGKMG